MSKKLRFLILCSILLAGFGSQIILKSGSQPLTFNDINILEYVEVDHQRSPTIVYVVDTRIKQSRDYISDVFAYLEGKNLSVNVIIIPLNKTTVEFAGDYRSYGKEQFGSIGFRKNAYYLFDDAGRSQHGGVIAEYPTRLLSQIYQILGFTFDYNMDDDLKLGETFQNSIFSEKINEAYSPRKYSCYVATGEVLCLGCKAGLLLLEFEKLKKEYPEVNFSYITAYDYTKDDIARFKKNNFLEINILLADGQLKNRWEELGPVNRLDGIMFVVGLEGTVILVTSDLNALKKWLGGVK